MNLSLLRTFMSDHAGHELDFDNQEFILCHDCNETFLLPEGSGVDYDVVQQIAYIEVPSGIANGHVTYTIDIETGLVEV